MVRVNARWIVTVMENQLPRGDASAKDHPRSAVCADEPVGISLGEPEGHLPVSHSIGCCGPYPTLVAVSDRDLLEESLFERLSIHGPIVLGLVEECGAWFEEDDLPAVYAAVGRANWLLSDRHRRN